MTIKQLSVFLENQPGRLSHPCSVLASMGINILTLSLADTRQYGILRLIVREWDAAAKALEAAGCVVNIADVVAVEVPDVPGAMEQLLHAAETERLNIDYMYAFSEKRGNHAIIILRFSDPAAAIEALLKRSINILAPVELFRTR
jgi:hypothetical protein